MALSKALLLKGVGGVAAVGTVTVGGLGVAYPNEFKDLFKSNDQINKEKNQKVTEVNEKLSTLGLEEADCRLATSDFSNSSVYSKDCVLDEAKFKKIKFKDMGDSDVNVQGWINSNNITLNISNKNNRDSRFLFKDVKDDLALSKTGGDQNNKITIKRGRDTEFELEDSKLSKVVDAQLKTRLEGVNGKLTTLSLPQNCSFDTTEKDMGLECALEESALKAIKFSNKKDSENLNLKGNVSNDLKVKIEIRERDDAHFSFIGLSEDITLYGDKTKGKIILKSSGTETFKIKEGRLEKVTAIGEEKIKKLQGVNKQLGDLDLPGICRFDEGEPDESIECQLTLEEFKKINLTSKEGNALNVSTDAGYTGFSNAKMKIELKRNEGEDEGEKEVTIFTLSDLDQKIKFGKQGEEMVLEPNNSYEFEVRQGKLGPKRVLEGKSMKISNSISVAGLDCNYTNNSNKGTCTTSTTYVDMMFDKEGGGEESESIIWSGNKENFNFWEYQEGYAEGIKFTYKGTTHAASAYPNKKLENCKNYELKADSYGHWKLKKKGD